MKNIIEYVSEGLKINSKTKVNSYNSKFSKEIRDKISEELCKYFQKSSTYNGIHYDTRFEVLEKFFNNWISDFLDYNQGNYEDLADKIGVDINELAKYIDENNDAIYKEIKDFVL